MTGAFAHQSIPLRRTPSWRPFRLARTFQCLPGKFSKCIKAARFRFEAEREQGIAHFPIVLDVRKENPVSRPQFLVDYKELVELNGVTTSLATREALCGDYPDQVATAQIPGLNRTAQARHVLSCCPLGDGRSSGECNSLFPVAPAQWDTRLACLNIRIGNHTAATTRARVPSNRKECCIR